MTDEQETDDVAAVTAEGYDEGYAQALKDAALTLDREGSLGTYAPKVYHFLKVKGECNCTFDPEGISDRECEGFNASESFRELYDMTEEEYAEHERQRREYERVRDEQLTRAANLKRRTDTIQRAIDEGIDPNLLP